MGLRTAVTWLGVQSTERRPGTRTTLVPGSAGPALTNTCADPELAFWRLPQGPGACSLKLRRECGPGSGPSTRPAGRPVTAPRRRALRPPRQGCRLGSAPCPQQGRSGRQQPSARAAPRVAAGRSARLGAGPARVLPSPHPAPHADLSIRDRQRQDSTTVVCRR